MAGRSDGRFALLWFSHIPGAFEVFASMRLFSRSAGLVYVGHGHAVDDGHALLSPKRLHGLCGLVVTQLLGLFVRDKHEVVLEQLRTFLDIVLLCLLWRYCVERNDERVLDAEYCVRGLVVGALDVQRPSISLATMFYA
jgi:hypothetical protein